MTPPPPPLRDLHLPEPVGWWPLAAGWWILLAMAMGAVGYGLWRVLEWRKRNAPRRYALRELARYESGYREHKDPVTLGKQLSELLRRSMLAYASREEIAGMSGDDWLIWLDRGMPLPYFHTKAGKGLLELPYRNPQDDFSEVDIDSLLTAVRMRLRMPLEESA